MTVKQSNTFIMLTIWYLLKTISVVDNYLKVLTKIKRCSLINRRNIRNWSSPKSKKLFKRHSINLFITMQQLFIIQQVSMSFYLNQIISNCKCYLEIKKSKNLWSFQTEWKTYQTQSKKITNKCFYCQNLLISNWSISKEIKIEDLGMEWMLKIQCIWEDGLAFAQIVEAKLNIIGNYIYCNNKLIWFRG